MCHTLNNFVVTWYWGYVGLTYVQLVRRATGSWTSDRLTLAGYYVPPGLKVVALWHPIPTDLKGQARY